MNTQQKAEAYNSYLRKHDKLEEQIADIKSEAAGMELNSEQKAQIDKIEIQKAQILEEVRKLFN
jgi:hypothetical protein